MILEPPWRQRRADKEAKDPHFLLNIFWSSPGTRELKGQNSGRTGSVFVFKIYCFYLFISCVKCFACVFVCVPHTCLVAMEILEMGVKFPGTGIIINDCEPPHSTGI